MIREVHCNVIEKLQAARFSLQRLLGEFPGTLNATHLCVPPTCYLCKKHTHMDVQGKKSCARDSVSVEGRTGERCLILLLSQFWELSRVELLRHDAAQTPNPNVLNTVSTLDCSLSCGKCLVFFPVWVQLKLQDMCQTGWDSFTTQSIPLQYCEEKSTRSLSFTYKQCILTVFIGPFGSSSIHRQMRWTTALLVPDHTFIHKEIIQWLVILKNPSLHLLHLWIQE